MKVLIIKLGSIGDVLRTTAILEGLKSKYYCNIEWITKPESVDILKNNQYISKIMVFDESLLNSASNIKTEFLINLDDDEESCMLATKIDADKIIGAYYKDGIRVYTEDSSQWFDLGLISRFGKERADELKRENEKSYQQHLYEILDIKPGKIILNLEESEIKKSLDFASQNSIKKGDIIIGFNTSAGSRWKYKVLPEKETINLISKVYSEFKAKILLFGGPGEKERNERIITKVRDMGIPIIDTGCDNSLLEFSALIDLCNLIVTSDSLAMHIATALEKKIVSFFTVTSYSEIEGYGRMKKVISDIGCKVCYKMDCDMAQKCNEKITANILLKAVKEQIE